MALTKIKLDTMVTGNLPDANIPNNITISNAGTATALETARTINGTSFDGSANITVTSAAGTLTGNTLASGVTASSLTSVGTLTGLTVAHNNITLQGTGETQLLVNAASGNNAGIRFQENSANKWTIGNDQSNDSLFFYDFGASATRFLIDSSGNVGIGGTPTTKFEVQDGNGIPLRFGDVASTPSATAGYIGMSTSNYNGNNGDLVLIPRTSAASNICLMGVKTGIGEAQPDTSLHIKGASDTYVTVEAGASDGNVGLLFDDSGSNQHGFVLYDTDDDYMYIGAGNSEKMRIKSDGKIGIGTTNPLVKFDVRNSTETITLNTSAGAVFESVPTIANNGTYLFGNGSSGSDTPQILAVNSNDTIAANNWSGIGFGVKYHSSANIIVTLAGIAGIKENSTDGSGGDNGALAFGTRPNGDYIKERMRIKSDGNVEFKNDIIRFHNDYTSRVYSGYTTGNAGFSVTLPIQDNSSLLITAIFTHYGAGIASYGCARMAWLSCRDNSQDPQDISSITSSNGGSWSISTSSSVVTVSKVAGSYSGGGHYWVKIEGSANV